MSIYLALLGALTMQVYNYHVAFAKDDRLFMKLMGESNVMALSPRGGLLRIAVRRSLWHIYS